MTIRGHGNIFDTQVSKVRYELFHAGPHQRLATRNTHFADTQALKNTRDPIKLRPRQYFVVIAIVFRVRRAAVHAAKITTVRDGDPQIGDLPSEFVVKRHVHPRSLKNQKTRFGKWNRAPSEIRFGEGLLSKYREARAFPPEP